MVKLENQGKKVEKKVKICILKFQVKIKFHQFSKFYFLKVGTVVKDATNGEFIVDLSEKNSKFLAARGGSGGLGNVHFSTGTNRRPMEFTLGKYGQKRKLFFELKSIADVGLVGYPNAGKS